MDFTREISTLHKPNSTLVMVMRVGKLNPIARKMYDVLLFQTQRQVQEFQRKSLPIEATHMFSAPIQELVDPISAGASDLRTSAKKYLSEMRKIEVDWEAPDANTGVIWNSMGLLSQAKLEIRNGVTWAHWMLPPDLLIEVSDPKRYTPQDFKYLQQLKSYAAIALYGICSRYKNNPTGVTSKNVPEWWVDALTNSPAGIDPETGEKRRREWRKHKSEHVLAAIIEINDKTDLTIELFEFKEGKAVTAVQFAVQKKRMGNVQTLNFSSELAEYAARLGVPLREISKPIDNGKTEKEVRLALAHLEARTNRTDLDPVKSRSSYFRRILDAGPTFAEAALTAPGTDPLDNVFEAEDGKTVEPLVPINRWRDHRRKSITDELLALPPLQQEPYIQQATLSLKSNEMLTPTLARRLDIGDWKSGVLLSKVFDQYVLATYGSSWDVDPGEVGQATLFGAEAQLLD